MSPAVEPMFVTSDAVVLASLGSESSSCFTGCDKPKSELNHHDGPVIDILNPLAPEASGIA